MENYKSVRVGHHESIIKHGSDFSSSIQVSKAIAMFRSPKFVLSLFLCSIKTKEPGSGMKCTSATNWVFLDTRLDNRAPTRTQQALLSSLRWGQLWRFRDRSYVAVLRTMRNRSEAFHRLVQECRYILDWIHSQSIHASHS